MLESTNPRIHSTVIFSKTEGNVQTVTHVAAFELGPESPMASELHNGTVLHLLSPGAELVQLAPEIAQAAPSLPTLSPITNSSSGVVVYQDRLDLDPLETGMPLLIVHQSRLSSLCASSTFPFLLVVITASICVLALVLRKESKLENQVEARTKDTSKPHRARRSRRNKRVSHSENAPQESAKLEHPQSSLEELEGGVPSLTDDVVRGPYKVEGAAVPTATEVHDANARALREVLKIPALWELNFADCVVPPVSTPYAQLKLAAVSHVVIGKNEGAGLGRNFAIEKLVDGLYVVGDTLEECPELKVAQDIVGAWLAEREEVRSREQGTELGIVWDCPPRV